tara:strand:- start:51 stop:662 length:612 start_codon:yes stop_codon:yes gene_type:complete
MANEQNHEIKSFGPQFFIETGSDRMAFCGRTVYFIGAATKLKNDGTGESQVKNNISFHETGLARYYTEKQLQIEAGKLSKDNEITMSTIVHHGDYSVNADNGELRLKAKNIVIEATNNLTLEAVNTIQIGYPEQGATKEVRIEAGTVQVNTRGGNIGDLLKTSSLFSSFAGSFVSSSSLASAASGMYSGPLAGAAGKFAKKFF